MSLYEIPITKLSGIGEKRAALFRKLGIETVATIPDISISFSSTTNTFPRCSDTVKSISSWARSPMITTDIR